MVICFELLILVQRMRFRLINSLNQKYKITLNILTNIPTCNKSQLITSNCSHYLSWKINAQYNLIKLLHNTDRNIIRYTTLSTTIALTHQLAGSVMMYLKWYTGLQWSTGIHSQPTHPKVGCLPNLEHYPQAFLCKWIEVMKGLQLCWDFTYSIITLQNMVNLLNHA